MAWLPLRADKLDHDPHVHLSFYYPTFCLLFWFLYHLSSWFLCCPFSTLCILETVCLLCSVVYSWKLGSKTLMSLFTMAFGYTPYYKC